MWLSGFFWGFIVGVAVVLKVQKWLDGREMPYRYVCPVKGCAFEMKASEMKTVDLWATTHERTHSADA